MKSAMLDVRKERHTLDLSFVTSDRRKIYRSVMTAQAKHR